MKKGILKEWVMVEPLTLHLVNGKENGNYCSTLGPYVLSRVYRDMLDLGFRERKRKWALCYYSEYYGLSYL